MADEEMSSGEVGRALVRIERNIEAFKVEMKTELAKVTDDHEKRLRETERELAKVRQESERENAKVRQDFATLRGWLIGASVAGVLGAGSGLGALFGGG